MNSRRRAELQRKLSMGAVPKPPAGLAERIKSDIPKYLRAESDRDRFSPSIAFNLRIAASIVLLVTSVVVMVHLLAPDDEVAKTIADAGPEMARRNVAESDAGAAAIAEERAIETAEASAGTDAAAPPPPAPTAAPERAASRRESAAPALAAQLSADMAAVDDAEARPQRLARAEEPSSVVGGVVGGFVGGTVGGATRSRADAPQSIAEAAPATAAAAPPPPPAPPSAPAIVPDTVPSAATAAKAFAYESESDAARPAVLGISTDPAAFDRVKSAIERGTTPPSASVDVEALVNYFAGQAERAPRAVRLEVEASPSPVEAEGNRAILRFTVDTPAGRGESKPVATDAHIEIAINDRVVEAIRPVGNGHSAGSGSTLHYGTSVTRLYELDLRTQLYASERVATVRLHYTPASGGRRRMIEHVIHARDLANEWTRASRRQRLASLGAIWAESLKGTAGGAEVAQRAEELATENPQDTRARELAKLANASSKLRGGGGTGSGP